MATKKISELTQLAESPSTSDYIAIVDADAGTTKYITIANLLKTINADTLLARSASGLTLTDDGSNYGVFIKDGGNVGVGTATPNAKLEVAEGNLYLSDSDIAHGMTTLLPTNVYGAAVPDSSTEGGIRYYALTEGDVAWLLYGVSTTPSTDGSNPVIILRGSKKSGTTEQAAAAADDLFALKNGSTNILLFKGNGACTLTGTLAVSSTVKANTHGVIEGDTTGGRVLRRVLLTIDNGTTVAPATLKCTVASSWNGDVIAETDNIGKGATTGNFTLDAGGDTLTIETTGITGDCVAVISAEVASNASATAVCIDGYATGNDIVLDVTNATSGAAYDLTTAVDTGVIKVRIAYITSA